MRSSAVIVLGALSAFVAISAVPAFAADFTGPVSGYAFDKENGAIRPINGFPGASLLGSPLELPVQLQSVAIRQTRNLAVGIIKETGALAFITSLTSTPAVTTREGSTSRYDIVELSANGEFGTAYSRADAKLIRLRNTEIESSISTAEFGDIRIAAVEDTTVLFATRTQLYRWTGDEVLLLASFDEIASVAFLNEGRDATVADKERSSIYLISDLAGSHEVSLLASEKEGISKPAALCMGRENRLVVANSDSTALVLDLATRSVLATLFLAAQPTRCEALNSNSLLILNDVGSAPLVLVDLSEMTSYFVPVNQR
jgi:hypothetical protein